MLVVALVPVVPDVPLVSVMPVAEVSVVDIVPDVSVDMVPVVMDVSVEIVAEVSVAGAPVSVVMFSSFLHATAVRRRSITATTANVFFIVFDPFN